MEWKETDRRTVTTDCFTFPANAVGNKDELRIVGCKYIWGKVCYLRLLPCWSACCLKAYIKDDDVGGWSPGLDESFV